MIFKYCGGPLDGNEMDKSGDGNEPIKAIASRCEGILEVQVPPGVTCDEFIKGHLPAKKIAMYYLDQNDSTAMIVVWRYLQSVGLSDEAVLAAGRLAQQRSGSERITTGTSPST
jgi:hypothetical protein